jgi:hypothetical protein
LVEQRFCVFEISGVEARGEPAIDLGKHRARFIAAVPQWQQPREARRRAQFRRFRANLLCERDGFTEVGFSQFGLTSLASQFAT